MADTPSLNAEYRKLHWSHSNRYFPFRSTLDKFPTFYQTGVTADIAKQRGMRRAQFISIVAGSFLVSQFAGLCVQAVEHLQYAVFLTGFSYGATYGLLPIIVIEWFGIGLYSCFLLPEMQELTFLLVPFFLHL